jgi:RNA polymerase sigma-70 factor (ECF subfamily)
VPDDELQLMRVLHDEHSAALWAHVVRLTGDRAFAEDVVQETLLRAWRHPRVLDQSGNSARAWLFTVAKNLVIDDWRKGRRRLEASTSELPEHPTVDDIDARLQAWEVEEAMRQLSAPHREVLTECFFLGRSVQEAAAHLGIPPGTVKSRSHYALRALRLILDEMGVTGV